jgi:hypothetical protein
VEPPPPDNDRQGDEQLVGQLRTDGPDRAQHVQGKRGGRGGESLAWKRKRRLPRCAGSGRRVQEKQVAGRQKRSEYDRGQCYEPNDRQRVSDCGDARFHERNLAAGGRLTDLWIVDIHAMRIGRKQAHLEGVGERTTRRNDFSIAATTSRNQATHLSVYSLSLGGRPRGCPAIGSLPKGVGI